jgi:hypothetical protein
MLLLFVLAYYVHGMLFQRERTLTVEQQHFFLKMEAGELVNLLRPDSQEFKTFEMEAMRLLLL